MSWREATEPNDLGDGCCEPLVILMSELGLPGNSIVVVQRDGVYFPVGLAHHEFYRVVLEQVPMIVSAVCGDTCKRSVVDVFAVEPAMEFGLLEVGMVSKVNIGKTFVVTGDV